MPKSPRLRTDYLTRLGLLETIRPTVYYMCARIDRQSAATGVRWNESLEDAQNLQQSLANGFTSVVLAALKVIRDERTAKDAFLQALHRAFSSAVPDTTYCLRPGIDCRCTSCTTSLADSI